MSRRWAGCGGTLVGSVGRGCPGRRVDPSRVLTEPMRDGECSYKASKRHQPGQRHRATSVRITNRVLEVACCNLLKTEASLGHHPLRLWLKGVHVMPTPAVSPVEGARDQGSHRGLDPVVLAVLSSRLTRLCSENVLTNLFCSGPKEQRVVENSVPLSPRRAQEGLRYPHTQSEPQVWHRAASALQTQGFLLLWGFEVRKVPSDPSTGPELQQAGRQGPFPGVSQFPGGPAQGATGYFPL